MKKWLYAFHGWMGLNFGLLLFIICLSGTVAVVSHEIDWLVTPALRVSPTSEQADWATMTAAVRQAYPDSTIQSVNAPLGAWFACEFLVRSPSKTTERVYVDPYRGTVTGSAPWFNTQRFFRDFHRRFFWYSWMGIGLVAMFGLVLFTSAATGLAFYKRWWAKLFVLRVSKGKRIFYSDLHRMTGVWTLLFAAVISVTGVWYLVELPIGWADVIQRPSLPDVSESTLQSLTTDSKRLSPDRWVESAQQAIPSFQISSIRFPREDDQPVTIEGQASAWLVRNRANKVLVDPYNADILFQQRAEELSPLARWADTADELHFGTFGGLTVKLIWFAFGLGLSALIPTGAYLWVRRRRQIEDGILQRADSAGKKTLDTLRLIHSRTRRRIAPGLLSTIAVWVLAIETTWTALAKQLDVAGDDHGWQALGQPGAIAVYGSFLLLITFITVVWIRAVWFPSLIRSSPADPVLTAKTNHRDDS